MSEDSKEKNYWIKQGLSVRLKGTDLVMTVDDLIYKRYNIPDGAGKERTEKRLVGIKCHWVDKEYKYQTGLFHTRELEKVKEPKSVTTSVVQ